MKVLIAEDDSTSAIVLRKALEKLGHEAVVATDGGQAHMLLTADTGFDYRIVISDWMMPGMDGLELTRKLREDRKAGDPYRFVILLTARGRPEDRRMGLEAGADDFMVKPLDMGDLIPRLSIAERMISLEDAIAAGGPAAPVSEGSRSTVEVTNPVVRTGGPAPSVAPPVSDAAEHPLPDEEGAKQILLAAVRDHDASEVHFEPQPGGSYLVRVRDTQGALREMPDITLGDQTKKFLVSQTNDKPFRLELSEQSVLAAVAVLPTAIGDRIRVTLLPTALLMATEPLSDLPMEPSARAALEAAVRQGKQTGGIVFVAGAKRYRYLKNRTIAALRNFVTDSDTIVLDDTYSKGSDRLLGQSPDVIVSYDFGDKQGDPALLFAPRTHGILLLTATDDARISYPTLLAKLTIQPPAPDSTNASNRYDLHIPDAPPEA